MPRLDRDGLHIWYEDHGKGTAVLLTHGRGVLAQRDARVIDSLPEIRVPTLVLWGARDEAFFKPSEYMAAKIPAARRVILPGAGHAVNLDQPQAFNVAVAESLDSIPS